MCDSDVIEMGQLSSDISTLIHCQNYRAETNTPTPLSVVQTQSTHCFIRTTPKDVFESESGFSVMFEESSRMKDNHASICQRTSSLAVSVSGFMKKKDLAVSLFSAVLK